MKFPITSLACVMTMALSWNVHAEIYKSEDAQGNPVFTDTPTAAAEKVDLPQENIADAVEVPSEHKSIEAPDAVTEAAGQGDVVVIPNSRNEQLEKEVAADRPHEVLDAEERYEVGDTPSAEEIKRREEAKSGEYIDENGNTVRVEHRGHAGGR